MSKNKIQGLKCKCGQITFFEPVFESELPPLLESIGWERRAGGGYLCKKCVQLEQERAEAFNKLKADDELLHQKKLTELNFHCFGLSELMGYFNPPQIMAWAGDEWEVFVRRKGSDEQFSSEDWKKDETEL